MGSKMIIDKFEGPCAFLSNFYVSKNQIPDYIGLSWDDVEHAYQASKATNITDLNLVRDAKTCAQCKKVGRNIICREQWGNIKLPIMQHLVCQKFYHNKELQELLLATEDAQLIEGNYWHDVYWGECTCGRYECQVGSNYLGKLLMSVRTVLRTKKDLEKVLENPKN